MSYSVDWVAKIVSIPTSDLTLVSGTRYSLAMYDFLIEIRRLESSPTDGLWAAQIVEHSNKRLDFAGANYAAFDEIINGYVIEFTGVADRVDLLGSNNDIIDSYVINGTSIVPSNSAGLQVITTGSGLDAGQDTKLTRIHALLDIIEGTLDHAEMMRILLAAVAGKVSGAETSSISFRDNADSKNRIVATTDVDGNRTSVTLDAS